MSVFRSILFCMLGLSGCTTHAEFKFLDWNKLKQIQSDDATVPASDLLLQHNIATICQISPYTLTLGAHASSYNRSLKEARLLPVGEAEYLFAYFNDQDQFVGSDTIPANTGNLRAFRIFSPDYVCFSIDKARIAITRSKNFISFGIQDEIK